jgi:DNA-directed RNA polymerase specialized sigma24 family protein
MDSKRRQAHNKYEGLLASPKAQTQAVIMNSDEADKLHKRALIRAKKLGHGEYAEDLAQDVMAKLLGNGRKGQTIDQAMTDCLRHAYGDKRKKLTGFKKRRAIRLAGSLETEEGQTDLRCENLTQETLENHERIEKGLKNAKRIQRAIFVLQEKWGFTLLEIGYVFGLSQPTLISMMKKFKVKQDKSFGE